MAIVKYTAEEMDLLPDTTDWEYLRNMKDEDIDTSDPDAPDLGDLLEKGLAVIVSTPKTRMQLNTKL